MCKAWKPEEINFLRQNVNQMSWKKLAEKLGCLDCQVFSALKQYNIQRTKNFKRNQHEIPPEEIVCAIFPIY